MYRETQHHDFHKIQIFILNITLHPFCLNFFKFCITHSQIIAFLEFYSKEPKFWIEGCAGSKKKLNCDLSKKDCDPILLCFLFFQLHI